MLDGASGGGDTSVDTRHDNEAEETPRPPQCAHSYLHFQELVERHRRKQLEKIRRAIYGAANNDQGASKKRRV